MQAGVFEQKVGGLDAYGLLPYQPQKTPCAKLLHKPNLAVLSA